MKQVAEAAQNAAFRNESARNLARLHSRINTLSHYIGRPELVEPADKEKKP